MLLTRPGKVYFVTCISIKLLTGSRYIHANYRFIVDPRGNYEQLVSVDDHVEWKDVLQVLVSSQSQSTNCPICLSDPVCPRMARCGHIFCLPCLIRYVHSTDNSAPTPEKKSRWKKCPICEDNMHISEVRPVRWFTGQEGEPPREGADVVLRLMKRDNDSKLALPREGLHTATLREGVPWYFAAEVMDYARIMKGTEDYMQSQYDQEIIDVELQEKEDELMFGEETQWTQKAMRSVREAKEKIKGIGNHHGGPLPRSNGKHAIVQPDSTSSKPNTYKATTEEMIASTRLSRSVSMSSTETRQTNTASTSLDQGVQTLANIRRAPQSSKELPSPTPFVFYQTLLHYYLSPLDIRILKAEFKDYSLFPNALLARVDHVSTGHIVDDDLRKRAKYLGHLPHGCEVGFLECDWTDVVSVEILEQFAGDLESRRKRNKDKETREEKERVRAEREDDDKRLASIRRRRISSTHDEATGSSIGIPGSSTLNNAAEFATSASPTWAPSRAGFSSLASASTSPSGPRTVWGTTVVPNLESPTLAASNVPLESENDGWLQGWEQALMGEDDVIAQVQAVSLADSIVTSSQGNKKKKHKKITLMSTNVRRGA